MKIYTKTGDDGSTSLLGGERVLKDHLRIEAYGTVDELNANLGVGRALKPAPEIESLLQSVQNDLFTMGADLASPPAAGTKNTQRIEERHVQRLEKEIDTIESELAPLRSFVLPAGSLVAAQLHIARTVCRRAERAVVRLSQTEDVGNSVLRYLNRLSDLLFVLARKANRLDGIAETPWRGDE